MDQDTSTQSFKFGILRTSQNQTNSSLINQFKHGGDWGDEKTLDFDYALAFIKVETNQPLFVYSINQMHVKLTEQLQDMSKSQLRALLRAKLILNGGDFQSELQLVFGNIYTGLSHAMIYLIVFLSIALMSIVIFLIYHCQQKDPEQQMQ